MSKIRVRNFGPIKEGLRVKDNDGWIEIKKVTLFIGNQGTGKSTLAKLISTFTWMEKALSRGDYSIAHFERISVFYELLSYHNIQTYLQGFQKIQAELFSDDVVKPPSEIDFVGESYQISVRGSRIEVAKSNRQNYHLPQIVYIPAERNLLNFTYEYRRARRVPETLIDLQVTYREIIKSINGGIIKLPINDLDITYNKNLDTLIIKGQDYMVDLLAASSGIQSIVPLFLISLYFANSVQSSSESRQPMNSEELERFKTDVAAIHSNFDLTDDQKKAALSVVAAKYNKTAFVNIVEEPEQNLFPTSQWEIIKSLLKFNNMSEGSTLVMTTHSPYIINYLTLVVKAQSVYEKLKNNKETSLYDQLSNIVPYESVVSSEQLAIYEIDSMGNVIELPDYKGLPSDENYLNQVLEKSNDYFSQLLDIEDQCR
ncbi:AAA family ATPase [Chitinophaga sp. S165]|uniref:AAA family ATPase n=1 Tax=Chitinophaga sp. S165 TaxID=2135462 RepID=UPI000D70B653|nr:AAA family ATPase [Chitinophaga sp. S165]PWV51613.1 putative ATPase [Chitinophaga sp. S165]